MIGSWRKPFVDICAPIVDADGESDFAAGAIGGDGCYVTAETHGKLIHAMEQSLDFVQTDNGDGVWAFVDRHVRTRGVAYAPSEDEPECFVWYFFNESIVG